MRLHKTNTDLNNTTGICDTPKVWYAAIKTIILAAICMLPVTSSYGQDSPADTYYNRQIAPQPVGSVSPSQEYYNNNLRSGGEWDDDGGPGGSGEGGNQGVGVPVGKGTLSVTACVMAYGLYLYSRRRKRTAVDS